MLEIAITTNILPHYRYGVHKNLSQRTDARIITYAGRNCVEPIRLMTEEQYTEVNAVSSRAAIFRFSKNVAFTLQWAALRAILKSKPDAVIVQGSPYEITSWILLLWGRFTRTPVLPWTIGLQKPETGLKWIIRKSMFSIARGLLVYGDYPKKLLAENGIDPKRIHVIYNSLDLSAQQQALANLKPEDVSRKRSELGIRENEQSFCFIGRITARKRLPVALKAIKNLSEKGIRVHFIVIGDGDDLPFLVGMAEKFDISDLVHFTGSLYDEDQIAEYMAVCVGAIIPEAGLPIVHPMSYALVPIVSNDIERHGTEWEAVREGKTGFFFEDDDPDSLASVIEKCGHDPHKTSEIGNAAQKMAWDRYNAESHAERIVEGVKRFSLK